MLCSSSTRLAVAARAYPTQTEAWLYIDSVFPIQIAQWDLRHYIGIFRQETLLNELQGRLDKLSSVHGFRALEMQPQRKDGGVFVRFSYIPSGESVIEAALREEAAKDGALPSWLGLTGGDIWLVKGSPWKEDMNRFASPILKVTFDGPDIQEQSLYEICRRYGRISDLTLPNPVPAGTLRSSTIDFHRLHSATIARNVIHGLEINDNSGAKTRLRVSYEKPLQAHAIRDWMSRHPKIMLPLIVFLLGTLTYTIFDPIRSLMVEAKILDSFDYQKSKIYQWLRVNTLDRLSSSPLANPAPAEEVRKERKEAQASIQAYLSDLPSTIAFVHGPQGSGKTTMLQTILKSSNRNALIIDCRALNNTATDAQLVAGLATQTGYWPVFTFLDSMNNLIDLASVGLMGQKAGLSSSLPDQLKQILIVVTTGLKGVSAHHRTNLQKQLKRAEQEHRRHAEEVRQREAIRQGIWHDGRLDCVSGNGVMCELGVGIEPFSDNDVIGRAQTTDEKIKKNIKAEVTEQEVRKQKTQEDLEAIKSLPIVIIRNYATSMGSSTKEDLLDVLAQWAATLTENQIAHVVVLSDNRENAKRLAKALPTKPLTLIGLSDADAASSLSFVKQKLRDAGIDNGITPQEMQRVERLGGRASDLESLIHKVRNGMRVDDAVEDIINRGVVELRKNAFGDDLDDAKGLGWTREQAWRVVKLLAKAPEVPYHDVLVEFPFKGDETALRKMEHAELIGIGTKDGRASTIRPGKPVFRWVYERLVNDVMFGATQELGYNEKQIAEAETKIKSYEQELSVLVGTMKGEERAWWDWRESACQGRTRFVGEKLVRAERKVETLERQNRELKRVIARGDHV